MESTKSFSKHEWDQVLQKELFFYRYEAQCMAKINKSPLNSDLLLLNSVTFTAIMTIYLQLIIRTSPNASLPFIQEFDSE